MKWDLELSQSAHFRCLWCTRRYGDKYTSLLIRYWRIKPSDIPGAGSDWPRQWDDAANTASCQYDHEIVRLNFGFSTMFKTVLSCFRLSITCFATIATVTLPWR